MDETEAIGRLKKGDIRGLEMLVERYQVEAVQAALMVTGQRAAAEDIVQTAFLRVFEKIEGFDSTRPFRPWFMRMVINDALKFATQQKRQVPLQGDEDAEYKRVTQKLDAMAREPEDAAQQNELVDEMRRAIERLSPQQRASVVMHYFLDLSTAEAAERLNCAPGTLRWYLCVARARLRSFLADFK
jgi:RNA polymerase sigma-70 factor (ECF subfamily)